MSEPTQTPIVVNASPVQAQIASAIRQCGAALGIIFAAFGMTAWAGKLNIVVALAPQFAILLTVVGPLVWGAFIWVGQRATIKQAKTLATIAADPRVPDSVAQVK